MFLCERVRAGSNGYMRFEGEGIHFLDAAEQQQIHQRGNPRSPNCPFRNAASILIRQVIQFSYCHLGGCLSTLITCNSPKRTCTLRTNCALRGHYTHFYFQIDPTPFLVSDVAIFISTHFSVVGLMPRRLNTFILLGPSSSSIHRVRSLLSLTTIRIDGRKCTWKATRGNLRRFSDGAVFHAAASTNTLHCISRSTSTTTSFLLFLVLFPKSKLNLKWHLPSKMNSARCHENTTCMFPTFS